MTILQSIIEFILFFIPRLIEDDAACIINEDGDYETVCSAKYMTTEELQQDFDAIVRINCFTWIGYAWPTDFDGSIVTWNRKV